MQKRQIDLYGFVNEKAVEDDMNIAHDDHMYIPMTAKKEDDTVVFPLAKVEDEEPKEEEKEEQEEQEASSTSMEERKRIQNLLFGISDTSQVGISSDGKISQIRTPPERDTIKLDLPKPKVSGELQELKTLINKVYEQSQTDTSTHNVQEDIKDLKSLIDKVYNDQEQKIEKKETGKIASI